MIDDMDFNVNGRLENRNVLCKNHAVSWSCQSGNRFFLAWQNYAKNFKNGCF